MPQTRPSKPSGLFAESALLLKHLPHHEEEPALLILKAHLIVEASLRAYVDRRLPNPAEFTHRKFSYSQIVVLCRSLAPLNSSKWIFEAAKMLNDARNKYAHELDSSDIPQTLEALLNVIEPNLKNPVPPIDERGETRLYLGLIDLHSEMLALLHKK